MSDGRSLLTATTSPRVASRTMVFWTNCTPAASSAPASATAARLGESGTQSTWPIKQSGHWPLNMRRYPRWHVDRSPGERHARPENRILKALSDHQHATVDGVGLSCHEACAVPTQEYHNRGAIPGRIAELSPQRYRDGERCVVSLQLFVGHRLARGFVHRCPDDRTPGVDGDAIGSQIGRAACRERGCQ